MCLLKQMLKYAPTGQKENKMKAKIERECPIWVGRRLPKQVVELQYEGKSIFHEGEDMYVNTQHLGGGGAYYWLICSCQISTVSTKIKVLRRACK